MSRKSELVAVRVLVTPEEPWLYRDRDAAFVERAEDVAKAIKRHVDQVESVSVEPEHEFTCGYCGARWTEDSTVYNGGCCDKDEEGNPNPEKVTP